jgi:hypothetical protein
VPAIPDGYPFLPDADLNSTIEEMLGDLKNWPAFSTLLPELKVAIIAMGFQERDRRETEELRKLTSRAADAADRAANWSLALSALSLAVATASVVVAALH